MSVSQTVGFILGFIGVVILVGRKEVAATPTFVMTVSAGLLVVLMYALTAPYIEQKLAGVSSLAVATGNQLGAAFLLLPALPLTIPQRSLTITLCGEGERDPIKDNDLKLTLTQNCSSYN